MIYLYIPDFDTSIILDIDIHGWVLYYLFLGYVIGKKLKDNAGEDFSELVQINEIESAQDTPETIITTPLRLAEVGKDRIFIEQDIYGKHIVYILKLMNILLK